MTQTVRRWIFYDSASKTQSNPVDSDDAQLAILKMSAKDTERYFIWTTGWEKWQALKPYLESKQQFFFSSFHKGLRPGPSENTIFAHKTAIGAEREVLEMKPADKEVEEEITKSSFFNTLPSSKIYSLISLKEEDIEATDGSAQFGAKFDAEDITFSKIQKPKIDFKSLNAKNLKDRSDRHELKIEILLITSKGKTFRSRSQNISMSGSLLEDNIPFEYCGKMFDIVVINTQPCDPKLQRVSLKAKTVGEGLTQRIHYINMTPNLKKALHNLLENYLKVHDEQDKVS